MRLPPVAIPKYVVNIEDRIERLENQLAIEKNLLKITLKFIKDCDKLERRMEKKWERKTKVENERVKE